VLHDAVREILTRTVCAWAGIALPEHQVRRRAREFGLRIDNAPRFGPPNWYARLRRRGTERWATSIIERMRSDALVVADGTAADVFARHRDPEGNLLPAPTAAIELINVLRPTVAIARFIVFAAVALEEHPTWRAAFAAGQEADLEPFVQEVRRYYPFFPSVAGHTREPFTWHGHRFAKGDWGMLDLYGTCRDRRLWENPGSFLPERFRGWTWEEQPHTLIAQGAGLHGHGHRCPGEWSTVELLKRATRLLAATDVPVPVQDVSTPLNRLPALPRSRFVLTPRERAEPRARRSNS
jgi:fatty-acid peroxygenase